MCTYKLLTQSSSGYLIQCKECGSFRFAFGTTEIAMNREELRSFQHSLDAMKYDLQDSEQLHRKTIRLAPIDSKVALALTPFEADELITLVSDGLAMFEVNKLLGELQ